MDYLPKELTELVDWSVTNLGLVIRSEVGDELFRRIESIRRFVKTKEGQTAEGLLELKSDLAKLNDENLLEMAHSFSLMLELINACESAYRVWRIRAEQGEELSFAGHGRLIHVLTAHPTESRNPHILPILENIQNLLIRRLTKPLQSQGKELFLLIKMAWLLPLSKQKRPSVMDEAEYIYSLSLKPELIDLYLQYAKSYQSFYLRTWVGGDKDGHPGVDETTLAGSLSMSRGFLLEWLSIKIQAEKKSLKPLESHQQAKQRAQKFQKELRDLETQLRNLKEVGVNDIKKVFRIKDRIGKMQEDFVKEFGASSPFLSSVMMLLKIFPGLVVPIELREESALVHEAVEKPLSKLAISRMLQYVKSISAGEYPRFYVRSLILSRCESANDMAAGVTLVQKVFKADLLPVVPLFESAHSLNMSDKIIEEFLASKKRLEIVKKSWLGNLEVMVGYSDSAKENGAFPSRYFVYKALHKLSSVICSYKMTPIFFHGSGGSIERGGGSVRQQTDWWPLSAMKTVKVTVQGEMIYRNYASPEILMRQMDRFAESRDRLLSQDNEKRNGDEEVLQKMADFIKDMYRKTVHDESFLNMVELATPYSFLSNLKTGSRPAKRQDSVTVEGLRAIPWVLCWTQTRTLFPTWWGVGSYWMSCSEAAKGDLKKAFSSSALFSSYIRVLSFTLKKVELEIFDLYLKSSSLAPEKVQEFSELFRKEYQKCLTAVREITGEEDLLWYRQWLGTSIELRSPLIHPLNIMQLIALERDDVKLLRESATGIASGMLTTG